MDILFAAEVVREKLHALSASLRSLAGGLNEESLGPAAVARHEHGAMPVAQRGRDARRLAGTALRRVDFHDDQDERRVVRFIGAVAVGSALLREAEVINQHKVELLAAIGTYRSLATRRANDTQQVRNLLIRLGYARLNLVQAYRKIPILDRTPTRIGFSWILGTNHVRVVNRDAAMQRVDGETERSPADMSRIQREVYDGPRGGLRLVEPVAPHVRANIAWYEGDERRTACIHAPLPVLYPFTARDVEPEVDGYDRAEPDPSTRPHRQRRSDARLRPIYGTIDVYRAS